MPSLDWIGKDIIVNHHKKIPYRVLDRVYSYDSNGQHSDNNKSKNMIIQGDNLVVLKSLLPRYEGKIDVVYIDPPYNTGKKDWCYRDDVDGPIFKKWLSEAFSNSGKEQFVNVDDLTRHDKWLCMMYPRLSLLSKLLSEDGVIFISINDIEVSFLKCICDEIFGSNNFITIAVKKGTGGRQDSRFYAVIHEYVLIYCKNKDKFIPGRDSKEVNLTKYDFNKKKYYRTQLLRKWGDSARREDRENLYYPIYWSAQKNLISINPIDAEDCVELFPKLPDGSDGRWRWEKQPTMEENIKEGLVEIIARKGEITPYERVYDDNIDLTKPFSSWIDDTFYSGTTVIKELINSEFPYPKSPEYIEHLIKMATCKPNCIVLDSFAGSGTTAHAVINLNVNDNNERNYILVEMLDYAESTTAERVKQVINNYSKEGKDAGSFSFYRIGDPIIVDSCINESVDIEKIREYIFHTETKSEYMPLKQDDFKYYLGRKDSTAYFFCYEKDQIVGLTPSILNYLPSDCDTFVIYADVCYIPEDYLKKKNIIFKKIPRDIGRF